jgi:hypothetical protein
LESAFGDDPVDRLLLLGRHLDLGFWRELDLEASALGSPSTAWHYPHPHDDARDAHENADPRSAGVAPGRSALAHSDADRSAGRGGARVVGRAHAQRVGS